LVGLNLQLGVRYWALCLVTQMQGNVVVRNIIYSTDMRTTEGWLADEDPQSILELPTEGGYLCLDHISTNYDSTPIITLMIQKRLNKLRDIKRTSYSIATVALELIPFEPATVNPN